ncbi:MAG: short-subunit dehydrogenase [Candidatus Omnitrophota bacterium]|jgi:short-subunit dehydrogenase
MPKTKSIFANQLALITGPTEGIGLDLAHLFAKEKCDLVLVSRDLGKLQKLQSELQKQYNIKATVFSYDLSLLESANQLIADLERQSLQIDILINNAGFGVYGAFGDSPLEPQLGMLELHINSPMKLAYAFLPGMRKRKRGGVLNVGSTAGFQPVPLQSVYGASKAFTLQFTEGLAEELHDSGVRVTCLCPGPTDTPFFSKEHMRKRGPATRIRMPSKEVAEYGLAAFKAYQVVAIPGWTNRAITIGVRLAPRSAVRKAARKVVESLPKVQ